MCRSPRDGSDAENFPFAKLSESVFHESPEANTCAFKYGAMPGPDNQDRSEKKKTAKFADRPLPHRFPIRRYTRKHGRLKPQVSGFVFKNPGANISQRQQISGLAQGPVIWNSDELGCNQDCER